AAGIRIATRMDAAYRGVLEHGLLCRAVAIDESDVEDSTTLSVIMRTGQALAVRERAAAVADGSISARSATLIQGAVLARLGELRSGDPTPVAAALRPDLPFDPLLTPQAIQLLAWNEVFEWSRAFLLLHAHRTVGQLADALLDPDQDFAVRRRIPRILAYSSSQRAVDGLVAA